MKVFFNGRFAYRIALTCLICSIGFFAGCTKTEKDKVTSSDNSSNTEKAETSSSTPATNGETPSSTPATVEWLESWDEAVELSKSSGKPILADFTGKDW